MECFVTICGGQEYFEVFAEYSDLGGIATVGLSVMVLLMTQNSSTQSWTSVQSYRQYGIELDTMVIWQVCL